MDSVSLAKELIKSCLQLGEQVDLFDESTPLLGELPEMNSLTIMTMVNAIEEELDAEISDTELSAEIFETLGSLAQFIETKM